MSNLPQSGFNKANEASDPEDTDVEPEPVSVAANEIDLDPYYDVPCTD